MVGALSFALVGGLVLILGILIHRYNEKHKYCHRTFPSGVSVKYCENSHKYAVCVGHGTVLIRNSYDIDSIFTADQYLGEMVMDYVDNRKELYLTVPPYELQFDDSCSAKNFFFERIYIRDSIVKAENAILESKEKVTDSLNITNHCYK